MRVAIKNQTSRPHSRRWLAISLFCVVALSLGIGLAGRPQNYWLSLASGVRAPRLDIGIKFKDLHPIHQQRDAALETGHHAVSDDDFAASTLEFDGHLVNARLRLAAGSSEALTGERWPLELRVTKGGHVVGTRALTLKEPHPGAHADALFLEHLSQHGVLATRLLFVEAVLNGNLLGLMALAEVPSIELLERQQRRDGIIVEVGMDPALPVLEVGFGATHQSSKASSDLRFVQRLVDNARDGGAAADILFDAETMGHFLAVADHWGRLPTLNWNSLRFYLNPLTARLEPVGIPAEGTAGSRDTTVPAVAPGSETPFTTRMLANANIRAAFERARETIAAAFADGSAWEQAAERESALRRLLHRDDPSIPALDFVSLGDAMRAASVVLRDIPADASNDTKIRRGGITPLPHRTLEENLEHHPFLVWNAVAAELHVRPGNWFVRGSIILPEGVALVIPAATVLRFEPQAGLIARGPLRFEGTPKEPIVLEGPPGTKRSELWSGVYVVESDRPSHWKHVIVRNTGGFDRDGWSLSGGVVFRKTHVELAHCSLRTSLADDALNLVRSSFRLSDLEIANVASDAIDFDYARGSVEGGSISRASGDGLDLGGSQVEVSGTRFSEILDKAISVGERSRLAARQLQVKRASIGIATKNASEARVADTELREISQVGLIAYTNRSEYGPGTIRAERIRFDRTPLHALAEAGSRITLDGISVPAKDVSVASVAALAAAE